MLNITIPVVPSQPNQITLFTSAASQHGSAFRLAARLMLILPEPWEQEGRWVEGGGGRGRVNLDLRRLIGIPLRASGAYEEEEEEEKKDGFLKRGFLTDKGLFAIGIKEGPAINHDDVRECSCKRTREERYARSREVISVRKPQRVYLRGVELQAESDRDKATGMQQVDKSLHKSWYMIVISCVKLRTWIITISSRS